MSNADELIKLKELLDEEIITKEEFEKKKEELLEIKKENNINLIEENEKSKKKKSGKKKIIIAMIIFLFFSAIIIGSMNESLNKQLENVVKLNEEQAEEAVRILNDCEITYGTIEYNNKYDNKEKKGYTISRDSGNCVILMIISDNKINSLKILKMDNKEVKDDKYLYKDNKKVAELSKYMQKSNSGTTSTTETFTLISDEGTTDSYGYTTITGKIKNNTNKTYSYVQVTFTLYDKNGNQVGTAMDNINNLEANGIWKYKAIGLGSTKASNYKCTGIEGW